MSDFLDDDQLQALASDLIVTSPSLPAPARVVAASDADGPVADFTPVG